MEAMLVSVSANARLPFLRRDEEFQFLRVTNDRERRSNSDFQRDQAALQLINARDWLALERYEHVAFAQARSHRRTPRLDADNEHALRDRQAVMTHYAWVNRRVLSSNSNPTPPDAALLDEPGGHQLRRVARNGEADSLSGQDDGGVYADDLAARIHERAAGVARIQGRVSLDDIIHEPSRLRSHRAPQRAYHPGGNRLLKAVRTANRDGNLADPQGL